MQKELKFSMENSVPDLPLNRWDEEMYQQWVNSNLSAHSLHMAELTMSLFGRKRAYRELCKEARNAEVERLSQKARKEDQEQGAEYDIGDLANLFIRRS